MAVKWAVASGNYNSASVWNNNTLPLDGDELYLDGHAITLTNLNLPNTTFRNDTNPNTGLSGGYLAYNPAYNNANYTFKKLIAKNTPIMRIMITNQNYPYMSLTSDIECFDNYAIIQSGGTANPNITINGNIIGDHSIFQPIAGHNVLNLTFNGNIENQTSNLCNIVENRSDSLTNFVHNGNNIGFHYCNKGCVSGIINGNVTTNGNSENINNLTLNGNLTANGGGFYGINGVISGNISYSGSGIGFAYINFTSQNPDTFVWQDITEPRSNPFIILTDAEMNNRQQYPSEDVVKEGVEYVWGEKVGTYQQPPESVVLKDFVYDNGGKIGSLENQTTVGCVTKEDVREGVELIGLQEVGTLVVPDADDVREGVVFDNGSVGTLIVEGGGDRLRIADFGYYTNAQSDTYIVDLTEQDKPKFAVAEERVLIEMFPDLDLENIPDKYFDDLFVKYLKYRLIVEYYRTAGINSTFTPSEPTTEIVNYRNVNCEIWMNIANIYLKAWGVKYPNSIKKQRILL